MNIDRGSFLMLVSTLAAGGAAGYVVAEKRVFPSLDRAVGRPPDPVIEKVVEKIVEKPVPVVVDASAPPPKPACDDSVGTPGDCPPPGYPTIEGGCGSFASQRCGEYKQALKPKVAAAAVECLKSLKPREQCDAARVTLCGHLALMNACTEDETAHDAGAGSVTATCQSIIAACGASPVAPSLVECRQLLSGMTDTGRERTRACMKAHCFDRGLVGCEAPAK